MDVQREDEEEKKEKEEKGSIQTLVISWNERFKCKNKRKNDPIKDFIFRMKVQLILPGEKHNNRNERARCVASMFLSYNWWHLCTDSTGIWRMVLNEIGLSV